MTGLRPLGAACTNAPGGARPEDLVAEFPSTQEASLLTSTWRSDAIQLYSNWLTYILGAKTFCVESEGHRFAFRPSGGTMMGSELLRSIARVESQIASGPIVSAVTPAEIRTYFSSRYDYASTSP
jgi:hypothetical protein